MEMAKKVQKELQELSSAILQMINTFNKMRQPIKETSEHVPEAHDKLNKVTHATEKATQEMLDIVDILIDKTSRNQEIIQELQKKYGDDSLFQELSDNFDENLNNSYSIMEALQFQDITTQQIDHISVILETIQEKLNQFLSILGENRLTLSKTSRAYNPEAEYERDPNRQENIDEIISSVEKKEDEES